MKRFLHYCFAIVAVAALCQTANAQYNGQQEIGSYQSILARAGYNNGNANGINAGMGGFTQHQQTAQPTAYSSPAPNMQVNMAPNMAVNQVPMNNGFVSGNCGGGCGGGCGGNCGGTVMPNGRGQRRFSNRGCATGNCGNGNCGNGMGDFGNGMTGGCGNTNGFGNTSGYGNNAMGYDANNMGGNYINQGYDGGCNTPVYSPGGGRGSNFGGQMNNLINRNDANWVGGAFGISFRRDYEDNRRLAYNGGNDLYSNDVEHGNFNGLGVSLAKRGCDGSGWEAIFWSLDEEDDYSFAGPSDTYLGGLVDVAHPDAASVWAIYNQGDDARIYRDTDIFNIEFNMLQNGGQYKTRSCRDGNYELYGGFRLFKFDESFRYVSNSTFGAYPAAIEYNLEAENTLLGFQAGGKNEICLTDRIRMSHAGSVGIFNNRVETRQRIFDSNAYSALDYMDTKDDVAMLAQIDVGLIYQLSQKTRCRIGYRAMGVAGVALAVDQIPYDFTDTRALQSANSNGSLLLHGFYFGSEHCF